MIAHIKGVVSRLHEGAAVVETHGIGYMVSVTNLTHSTLAAGEEVILLTHAYMREDGISLYGFLTQDELDMFGLLITVTGVGPKAALGVLNAMRPKEVTLAILTDDAGAFVKAPGIGKKTAQMIILKLKDKLAADEKESALRPQMALNDAPDYKRDAIEALISLGYSKNEALKAVLETALPEMKAEQIIRLSLRKLNR